jgi:hypothetical protein
MGWIVSRNEGHWSGLVDITVRSWPLMSFLWTTTTTNPKSLKRCP